MRTLYDLVGVARVPGVETTFKFKTENISPRIRKAAIKMIQTGETVGSYQSKAKKLAELLDEKFQLRLVRRGYEGHAYVPPLPQDAVEEVMQLVTAGVTWKRLTYEWADRYGEDYWSTRIDDAKEDITTTGGWIDFCSSDFSRKAYAVVEKHTEGTIKSRREEAVKLLLEPTVIELGTHSLA